MEIGGSDRKPADARGGVLPRRGIYVDRTYAAAMDRDAAEAPGASKTCVWRGLGPVYGNDILFSYICRDETDVFRYGHLAGGAGHRMPLRGVRLW